MEKIAAFIVPAIIGAALFRLMLLPIRWVLRLLLHAGGGLICLWLLNSLSPFTGIVFPINTVTVLTSGILGIPGIFLLAALEL